MAKFRVRVTFRNGYPVRDSGHVTNPENIILEYLKIIFVFLFTSYQKETRIVNNREN